MHNGVMSGISLLSRYISAIAITIMVWDHIVTAREEFSAMFRKKRGESAMVHWLSKTNFIFNRYFVEALMVYIACGLWNISLNDNPEISLKIAVYLWAALVIGTFIPVVCRIPLLVRLDLVRWSFRGDGKYVPFAMFTTIVIVSGSAVALFVRTGDINEVIPNLFILAVASMVVLEFFILILQGYRSMKPKDTTHVKQTKTDKYTLVGLVIMLGVRIVCLMLACLQKAEPDFLLTMFLTVLSSVFNSRLQLQEGVVEYLQDDGDGLEFCDAVPVACDTPRLPKTRSESQHWKMNTRRDAGRHSPASHIMIAVTKSIHIV